MRFVKVMAVIAGGDAVSEILINVDTIQVIDGDNVIMGNATYVKLTPESLIKLRVIVGAEKGTKS